MKDEIKEILDLLNFNRDAISNRICCIEDFISREQIIKLLDYITNLQEENERLNLELTGYREAILRDDKLLGLKSRNQKAIEYIKCGLTGDLENDRAYVDENYLLNTLNGGDDNEYISNI